MLSFGVNLRVQGLLSVHAVVSFRAKCTLITSLSEFISVFKQPTSSVVFRRFKCPQLKFSFIVQIFSLNMSSSSVTINGSSRNAPKQLMHQAFQVLTIDNVGGTLHLDDGSFVSMRQCIDEFALTSKTCDGATIKRLLK